MIDNDLLKILACPQCKNPLKADEINDALLCEECLLSYPIHDGIPILLVDKSKKIKINEK